MVVFQTEITVASGLFLFVTNLSVTLGKVFVNDFLPARNPVTGSAIFKATIIAVRDREPFSSPQLSKG